MDGRIGFSFTEVTEVLADMFRIHERKRGTFSARLQQLQRLGIPRGANPGRGVRFLYSHWQLAEFALCVDLLDAGIPPGLIKTHLGQSGFYSMGGLGEGIETAPRAGGGVHLIVELNALDYLRSGRAERISEHAADHVFKTRTGAHEVLSEIVSHPSVVINVSARLADLKESVARVLSNRASEEFFPETPPQPGKIA